MFHNFLMTMAPLKNGMNLRENTIYMLIFILTNRLYSRKMEIYLKKKKTAKMQLILSLFHS